ncbi:MAG: FAD-binding and (Fe-S)-binding domain-containing protein [Proteobacteria bacterium]|nr:FAD-binding and (Fe-S)-binding domain-containing protein [Pseudomonadota bacterium]
MIYPKQERDISLVLSLLERKEYRNIAITAKGGGTSTNGQCLAWQEGIILDTSRFMNHILEICLKEQYVRVQSGVVLGRLNEELAKHGYMFAPTTSTSSRVTIGGMVSTNASGIGSSKWGRTSDHLKSVRLILLGGESWDVTTLATKTSPNTLSPRIRLIIKRICEEIQKNTTQIARVFQKMPRSLTGYNLDILSQNTLHLPALISGSEGTLGIISECTLAIVKKPRHKTLLACVFKDWDACLQAGQWSVALGASCVEALDHSLLTAARNDITWHSQPLATKLSQITDSTLTVQLVEFDATDQTEIEDIQSRCIKAIESHGKQHKIIAWHFSSSEEERLALWNIRKNAVGLFAASSSSAHSSLRSCAFIEDAAVHPQDLPEFIKAFGAILDKHQVPYGMYGHLDAGCMHVRPKLDTAAPQFAKQIARISEDIKNLSLKYKGLLWGEHGKGLRSQYTKEFFGDTLYDSLQVIKTLFDPHYQLNCGKICPPQNYSDEAIPQVDEVPMRADHEHSIPHLDKELFADAYRCDGNGLCFSVHSHDIMCPSFRATGSRVHSPKGRAAIIRAWLQQSQLSSGRATQKHSNIAKIRLQLTKPFKARLQQKSSFYEHESDDISEHLYHSLNGCLSCRACSGTCPLKVDIPELKSRFLDIYHKQRPRPLRDYIIAFSEDILPRLARNTLLRTLYNTTISLKPSLWFMKHVIRLCDPPPLCDGTQHLKKHHILHSYSPPQPSLLIVADMMSLALEKDLLHYSFHFLEAVNLSPYLAPYSASGKSWHLRGFLKRFSHIALTRHQHLEKLAASHTLMGIDPAFTFTYRGDYAKYLPKNSPRNWHVLTPQECLHQLFQKKDACGESIKSLKQSASKWRALLVEHCFERTTLAGSAKLWQEVCAKMDISLEYQPMGCCGMAGFFGHEKEHLKESKDIFSIHWQNTLNTFIAETPGHITPVFLVPGGSCRMQIKRFFSKKNCHIYHPLEWLGRLCKTHYEVSPKPVIC